MYEPPKLFVPEVLIENGLNAMLETIRFDFKQASDETETILYHMFNGLQFGNYNFFTEAKKVIIEDKEDNPRKLEIRAFFDPSRANMPTIHITLPGEDDGTGTNAIGVDRGSFPVFYNDPDNPTHYLDFLGRRFRAQYNIVVTSNNSNEVVLIYNFLKGAFIAFFDHWSVSGFDNLSLGGGDLDEVPNVDPRAYMRVLSMGFEYQVQVLEYFEQQIIKNFTLLQELNVT